RHHAVAALRVADASKLAITNALKTRSAAQAAENHVSALSAQRNCILLPASGVEPHGCPPARRAPTLRPALASIEKLSKEISAAQVPAAVLTRKADSASALLAAVVAGGGLISSASARADDVFDASRGATVVH